MIATLLAGRESASAIIVPSVPFATQVAAYTQGTVAAYDTGYDDTTDWTGIPTGTTGAPEGAPGVVTPFYPPFDTSQILLIGNGGHLTLQFPTPVPVKSGPFLGIFSTCGFVDSDGNGDVGSTAATFGGGLATVQVSQDGTHWFSLGQQNIDVPQNFYLNAGPYDVVPPADSYRSDYGLPYTGGLSAFANESDAQVIATLNGSAGGTWLDISSTGLSTIRYVDFSPPANAPSNWQLAIEAVSTVGPSQVPEPGGISTLIVLAMLLKRSKIEDRKLKIEDRE